MLTRLGDVYSPVVNLASRLTSLARPSTVLVDRELAQQLRGNPATGCGRSGGCRCAATTTSSRGWSAAGRTATTTGRLRGLLDEIADDVPDDEDDASDDRRLVLALR